VLFCVRFYEQFPVLSASSFGLSHVLAFLQLIESHLALAEMGQGNFSNSQAPMDVAVLQI
jgi:hypothetical protein